MIINNDNHNDKHNSNQRRPPDGGGSTTWKTRSITARAPVGRLTSKSVSQNPHGVPDHYEAVSGLLPGRGWKTKIQGGGGGGEGGAEPGGRHKNFTDRPETKTIDAGDHTEWGKRHGDICRGHMTWVFDENVDFEVAFFGNVQKLISNAAPRGRDLVPSLPNDICDSKPGSRPSETIRNPVFQRAKFFGKIRPGRNIRLAQRKLEKLDV